jgi:uncharacterized protein YndB with AHSA1/START domain
MHVTRTTRASRIESDALRIEIEQVSPGNLLTIRLRPASVPPGATEGPRVAMSFTPSDALTFADELQAHAMTMQTAARAYAAEVAHRNANTLEHAA